METACGFCGAALDMRDRDTTKALVIGDGADARIVTVCRNRSPSCAVAFCERATGGKHRPGEGGKCDNCGVAVAGSASHPPRAPRLLHLGTLIGMWRRGALRGDELQILMGRLLAVVAAATRLVQFWHPGNADRLVDDLRTALDEPPPAPPPGGWVAKITILLGCMSDRDMGAAVQTIAADVARGGHGGHGSGSYTWTISRPGGHGPDRAALLEAFHERRRGWTGSVEAVLLACDALATAEESEGIDSMAMERAEGAVEELEATIGAEAAHWWRRRLRDLQREQDAARAESEVQP